MKKNSYTLIEILTVVAIIAVLASLVIPAVNSARQRSIASACISNQGQTAKLISAAIDADKMSTFYSGKDINQPAANGTVTAGDSWITVMFAKNRIVKMNAHRCPALNSSGPETLAQAGNAAQKTKVLENAYGVVFDSTSGKFDFRGSKLFTTSAKDKISPNSLAMGGCSAKTASNSGQAESYALIDFGGTSSGRPTAIHSDSVNIFFYDGSARSYNKQEFENGKIYYPSSSDNQAKAVANSSFQQWDD